MISIRAASPSDIGDIAHVDVETWRQTYPGVLPDAMLLGLSEERRAASWMRFIARRSGDTLVATSGDKVVGFGTCGWQSNPDLAFSGEVFTLYVLPDFQGDGIGRSLMLGLFARLIRIGSYSGLVWVLQQNPARFFYERLGGKAVATRRIPVGRNSGAEGVAYGWPDLAQTIADRGLARRGSV